MPDWYPLVRAARALGVAPWALQERSTDWLHIGLALIEAEGMVAEYQSRPQKPPPAATPPMRTLGRA